MKKTSTSRTSTKVSKTVSGDTKTKKVAAKAGTTVKKAAKGAVKEKGKTAKLRVARMPIQQSASSSTFQELTKKQIKELNQKLLDLKVEIANALEEKANHFDTSSHNESIIKGDDAEVAEKQRQSNAALQEMDMLKNRLVMVDRALMKVENKVYGLCEETEEPIAYERLLAIPWARYGVKVQEMRERRLREYKGTHVGQ